MSVIPLDIRPDPDDPACAQVRVRASVGDDELSLIVDTGAARTRVLAREDLLSGVRTENDGSGGVFGPGGEVRIAGLSALRLGDLTVEGLEVEVTAAPEQLDSLLGIDVLGRYRCVFKFSNGTLTLERSGPDAPAGSGDPLQIGARGHALLGLRWGEVAACACWDSGAGITVVDRAFAARHPELFRRDGVSTGTDSLGASRETVTGLLAGPTIGDLRFAASVAAIVDLGAVNATAAPRLDLILGYPLIAQADWVLDFPARSWRATLRAGA